MKRLLLALIMMVLLTGCDPLESNDNDEGNGYLVPDTDAPALVIYNDSILEIHISYSLTNDDENVVEATILPDSEYEIDSGVTEITIDGGSF